MTDYMELAQSKINVLRDAGFKLTKEMIVLDFGCGQGNPVKAVQMLGYDTYDIDVVDCSNLDEAHYAKIGFKPYVLLYEDDFLSMYIAPRFSSMCKIQMNC